MSKQSAVNPRKKLFVNAPIQGAILRRFAAYWLVYHLVLWHVVLFAHFLQNRAEMVNGETALTFSSIYFSFCSEYYPIIVAAVVIFPILAWDAVKLSHRIVGPFVPFTHALRKLRKGERAEPVKFRKNDLLSDFHKQFNEFIVWQNQVNEKKAVAAKFPPPIPSSTEEGILQKLADLKKTTEGIHAIDDQQYSRASTVRPGVS